LWIFPVSQT